MMFRTLGCFMIVLLLVMFRALLGGEAIKDTGELLLIRIIACALLLDVTILCAVKYARYLRQKWLQEDCFGKGR